MKIGNDPYEVDPTTMHKIIDKCNFAKINKRIWEILKKWGFIIIGIGGFIWWLIKKYSEFNF